MITRDDHWCLGLHVLLFPGALVELLLPERNLVSFHMASLGVLPNTTGQVTGIIEWKSFSIRVKAQWFQVAGRRIKLSHEKVKVASVLDCQEQLLFWQEQLTTNMTFVHFHFTLQHLKSCWVYTTWYMKQTVGAWQPYRKWTSITCSSSSLILKALSSRLSRSSGITLNKPSYSRRPIIRHSGSTIPMIPVSDGRPIRSCRWYLFILNANQLLHHIRQTQRSSYSLFSES